MATLREIRNAISADMHADGIDPYAIFAYRENFKQSVRISDDKAISYTNKDKVAIVTRLSISVGR